MLSMEYQPPVDISQVTGRVVGLGSHRALQSKTDCKGIITQASRSLAEISGFSVEELIGQPHNILRHPDMPDTVYYLMWKAIGEGEEFFGIVKNRCKSGDHYWVLTRVAPIRKNGEITGYTSARFLPRAELVPEWETLFREMREAERNARGDGEARFRPAIDVINRFVHRRGYDTLQQMVLSARA
ncbi:PAS domain S-box protein [Guyparkeria hydrothermalis]|uniref:PAS domain-containing protein n=1 Tax=Guyparkeria hydrothermalis TaxID=923 RepID=UPI00201FF98D|nr:PAS domain-containing protein [Guyparkeria hydrothermalis]MCL7744959.1 PAS domain S-box protein [Guyparkeria hydrothermalis]